MCKRIGLHLEDRDKSMIPDSSHLPWRSFDNSQYAYMFEGKRAYSYDLLACHSAEGSDEMRNV